MAGSDKTSSQETLLFEDKDLAIFKIPDIKTRLNTIQNYFFPRLDKLLSQSVELIQEIYGVNPYDRLTIIRTPDHRKEAKNNKSDRPYIRIGLGGKRKNEKPLKVLNKSGKPYWHPLSRLYYNIEPTGEIFIYLWLFGNIKTSINLEFIDTWREIFFEHKSILEKILCLNHISHGHAEYFLEFTDILHPELSHYLESDSLQFLSYSHYFPISFEKGIFDLQLSFAALYPLLHISIDCELGQPHELTKMLKDYQKWYRDNGTYKWYAKCSSTEASEDNESLELLELDSYKFIRPGLWWEVLARDRWTCCSCGRTVKEHQITLHVDHIIPRSKGGTDCRENLQALCRKCNIGKSNRDSTTLTSKLEIPQ